MDKILSVNNLSVILQKENKKLVNSISFKLEKGSTLGIVGESGSGKSLTALSILQLLEKNALKIEGEINFFNNDNISQNIISIEEDILRKIRGNRISMIFQEPMTSLNPVISCGNQVAEAIQTHQKISKKEAQKKVVELFNDVKIPNAEEKYHSYPHQLSGGQKQRVMIAMAIANNPSLLIADEPTTALDVTVQKEILVLLKSLINKYGMAMIFISHDLGLVANVTDQLLVMYKGEIMEMGNTNDILKNPTHPYTKALLSCKPSNNINARRLPTVKDFTENSEPNNIEQKVKSNFDKSEILIEVKNLSKHYSTSKLFSKAKNIFKAVDDVNFQIKKGETLGLVGESGCGKTTLSRSMLRLIEPTAGEINYKNENILRYSSKSLRDIRKQVQIIFQDPFSSLNPRLTVGAILTEPMMVHKIYSSSKERKNKSIELLEKVGLTESHMNRYVHEFSGGQRQRISIARALALQPEFIICDESVSALDVSVQAQVLNLLNDLKDEFNLTYLFISHDLSVVRYMSDRMMVMKNGKIEESNDTEEIFMNPKSDYTKKLIEAIP
jgi:peptide/nickel transport system ATP-binding protein